MKIKSLKISNILSFKYYENISQAPEIVFDKSLNLLIGENGAGKSTALEVLNFVFKKVLFKQFSVNYDIYSRKSSATVSEKKQTISTSNTQTYSGFRLDPNWDFENAPQIIKLTIELDEIDSANMALLLKNREKIIEFSTTYASYPSHDFVATYNTYDIEISLQKGDKTFSAKISPDGSDPGYLYLVNYNFYKELIEFYNIEYPSDQITPLYESFVLIGGYRNYYSFTPSVSLGNSTAINQIEQIKQNEFLKSTNSNEQSEPSVFSLVRLRVAEKHYQTYGENMKGVDCENEANNQLFLKKINQKLKLVNLEVKIQFTDKQKWQYSFHFFDIKRNKPLQDINSLSAGQKAIIHLTFEAYGRGDLKGGLVIIDEPEIHLHYQFQSEYLHVIEELNKEQSCQYILVTHSESLISSDTIDKVKRFALDQNNYTTIKSPQLTADHKTLIKILDNTRSTYAFFAKKIILVEGDTDRYFFKAILNSMRPDLNQEIAILDIGGKGNYKSWKEFFEDYGLSAYFIGDFDNVFTIDFSGTNLISKSEKQIAEDILKQTKLDALAHEQKLKLKEVYDHLILDTDFLSSPKRSLWKPLVDQFNNLSKTNSSEVLRIVKERNPNIDINITDKYSSQIFILKNGSTEDYVGTKHGDLTDLISFCENKLPSWLQQKNSSVNEIRSIIENIVNQ
jgi:predicted ATP-dependent endonuclease of OLD family